MSEQLQLQISLSIGSQRYQIRVPKQAQLPSFVREFLTRNRLNPKYEASIVRMVLEKLEEHATTTRRNSPDRQHKRPAQQKQTAKPVAAEYTTQNQQQKIKQMGKIQQYEQRDNFEDSRRIFQAWKLREKEKEKRAQEAKHKQPPQTTKSPFRPQRHQSDYFYKKGLQFQKSRQLSCQRLFKQHYPFQIRERVLTESDQAKLFDRLHYHRKGSSQCTHFPPSDSPLQREHRPSDPVKDFLRSEDDKIDRQIHKMLRSGQLSPSGRPHSNGRTVFRKTILN